MMDQDETLMNESTPVDAAPAETETHTSDTYEFWAEQPQNAAPEAPQSAASGYTAPQSNRPIQQSYGTTQPSYDTTQQSYGATQPPYGSAPQYMGQGAVPPQGQGAIPPQGQGTIPPQGYYNPYYYSPNYMPQPPVQKPKKEHRFFKKAVTCVLTAACFGLIAGATFLGVRYAYDRFFPQETTETTHSGSSSQKPDSVPGLTIPTVAPVEVGESDGSDIVAKVVEQTMPAMVSINSTFTQTTYYFGRPYVEEESGSGSGIIVGSNDTDLLIATNYHVIEDATSLETILADGTKHTVTVKGSDPAADLAIVALPLSDLSEETRQQIDIAILGDSDSAQVGQMVIAIGNALGYGRSVTVGYLSAKEREIELTSGTMTLLQTNAAINPGNSGGALLNTKGEVIGINNAKISSTSIEGICFAIPISKATPILEDLMTREILSDEEKGYLGVNVQELDSVMFQLYNWPEGVYVSNVIEGGSAEAAGIYKGDIITHVNGSRVTTTNQLINSVTSHRHGETIEITLQRIIDGRFTEMNFTITLQPKPTTTDNQKN